MTRYPSDSYNVTTYQVTTERGVYHMQLDRLIQSNLLFSEGLSLRTTDGDTMYTVVDRGQTTDWITGFHQLSKTDILILIGSCIRSVDRQNNLTTTVAGTCGKKGYADGKQALFWNPLSIIPDNFNQGTVLISDWYNHAVRWYDIDSQVVGTFYRAPNDPFQPQTITQDSVTGDLYIATFPGIYHLQYADKSLTLLAGHRRNWDGGWRDGSFADAQFSNVYELILVDDRSKLIAADSFNNRLRILDLKANTTSSICMGDKGHVDGDERTCTLYTPNSMLLNGTTLYIGEYERIRKLRSMNNH